ncbi:MAG TPA: HAMP domain-containing histidine kinase [Firmicutes bacterium]|nr:HAMP domain-containing histidine kinase [Bacillota bacterium]
MTVRGLWKTVLLVAGSALLIVAVCAAGLLTFIYQSSQLDQSWNIPLSAVSDALAEGPQGYVFTAGPLLDEQGQWAMLLDAQGRVIWQWNKPADVPDQFTLNQVASFSRWYLSDYPVQVRTRPDGLLVVGSPKGSTWKYSIAMDSDVLARVPAWLTALFLVSLLCVIGLSAWVLRRWFRKEQRQRDAARSDWIHGVSHDIRTPLSMVMGYASQLETDPALPAAQRRQAAIIRHQSQTIRDLVNDLNLTMRLDYQMQPLRREPLSPAALVRQVAADALNGGLPDAFPLEVSLSPSLEGVSMNADGFLLRRALQNLLNNCVRHHPAGCAITLGAAVQQNQCILWVENTGQVQHVPSPDALPDAALAPDGGAAHGTGLRLVRQIAEAHGGTLEVHQSPASFCCRLQLPLAL